MKQVLLFLCFIMTSCCVHAQGTFSNTGSGLNDMSRYMEDDSTSDDIEMTEDKAESKPRNANILQDVTMDITDSVLTFEHLPEKGNIIAHITSSGGDVMLTKTINAKKTSLSVKNFSKDLFFVTLTYKNFRKAFELNRAKNK